MMTREQAIDFGRASAEAALDQVKEWGSLQNSIDNYRDNLRDTLNEERASQHEPEAFAAFDALVAAARSRLPDAASPASLGTVVRAHCDRALSLLQEAVRHAEWHDKHIYPCRGAAYQTWTLTIYLPVPLSAKDKSPEAALRRALGQTKKTKPVTSKMR